jgi:histidinol phosphatase-like PHP family hydrolase
MNRRSSPPSNGALAEALFSLSEHEQPGERRLAFLRAAYTAFDATGPAQRVVLDDAPPWLQPLISQLVACDGHGALEAAVERLSSGGRARRRQARENFLARRDVSAVLSNAEPALQPQRMRGACHWHTRDSDGKATLETMARACRRRGHAWGMVTDHSRGLEVASGLDREGVRLQRRRVDRWNHRNDDFRLFQGLEVEILEDGTVDVSAAERSELDCIVAAVHRHFDPDRDQTERLLRAVSTPGVDVLAHPRARHFHQRKGLRVRWEKVFAACAEHDVAVEINGFPRRQDLDPDLARLAGETGCTFLLASDAHAPHHLEFDAYACAIAALAKIDPATIVNARQSETFEDWLRYGV